MTKSQFESITIKYKRGDEEPETFTIPPEKVFGAIETIEEYITLKELSDGVAKTGQISMTRLARAYAAVLRYAGAKNVVDEEVYVNMFSNDLGGASMVAAVNGLLGLMIPPAALAEAAKKSEEETGKPGESQGLESIRAVG